MIRAGEIWEHMEVVGSDGGHVGTVDYVEGDGRLVLTKSDSPDGHHHSLHMEWVESVDAKVHLSMSSGEALGLFTADAR